MKETKVITDLKEISNAINNKPIDLNSLVWKAKGGEEIHMLDMNQKELQRIYDHTNDMLYNTNKYTPGRFQVKKNIRILINNCNAELLLRFLIHECGKVTGFKNNLDIVNCIREFKAHNGLTDSESVATLFSSLPEEYESVTLGKLMDACLDGLDVINRKMITDQFIISQGIWLTEEEKQDLTEFDSTGKQRSWMDVIKERLILNNVKLRVDPKGFTYNEFRSLVHLGELSKISTLPSDTLRLLRDKVFLLLDVDTDYHINKWESIKKGIEQVAEYKEIALVSKSYE